MTIRLWFPTLAAAALALICVRAEHGEAGSFFGPSCYGADYGYQYPDRSHNAFGSGPGQPCTARHPLFKHRWLRKHQDAPADGVPVQAMPVEHMAPTMAYEPPHWSPPVQATSVVPVPMTPPPAVSGRIEPIPAPLPAGPAGAEPVNVNQSSKPPF